MLAFLDARLVLLSVPKTGTTALEVALRPHAAAVLTGHHGLKHIELRAFQRFVAPVLDRTGAPRFETVAVLREPVDRLKSWYRYNSRDEVIGRPDSTAKVSFQTFVEGFLSDEQPPYARIGRQSWFVQPLPDRPGVDHLFRYEAMDAVLAFLSERLRRKIAPARMNVSPDADTSLDPALEGRLRAALADEIALWESARC